MPVIAAAVGLAAMVWGAIYARRGSLVVGCGLLLAIAYVFGHEFWNAKIGPLPLTLDRLALAGLLAALVVQWRIGRLEIRRMVGSDWAVVGMLTLFALSALMSGQPEVSDGVTSKWGRLAFSFALPALLYGMLRQSALPQRDWSRLLLVFVALGVYLACTAVFEIAGAWSLVFPRYIADPGLGIHFGRARGPELNAASLGIYLTACFWCAWTLVVLATRRWQQLAIAATLPLMALGVLLTYTRSTWLGLAASGMLVAAIVIPRRWRLPALAAAALGGLLLVAGSWSQLVGLEREGTAAESLHSVDQRTSFAYVSWEMFRDHPVFGVGFGRFYDRKLPYLSDRSQDFELESIRSLHHHNTLLGVLTETGIVGLTLFAGLMMSWARHAWRLAQQTIPWVRAQGILMLAILASYACSALFHDLTLVPSQHWLLFVFAGMTVTLRQMTYASPHGVTRNVSKADARTTAFGPAPATPAAIASTAKASAGTVRDRSIELFGMKISRVTMRETVDQLLGWCGAPRGDVCRYVVTPNVDHAVLFQERGDLRAAYADASLVLADGAPIVLASQLVGRGLPERVAGSDLVPQIFAACRRPLRVFLLGAAPGVAELAARRIGSQWRNVHVVGTYSPPLGFEHDDAENMRILSTIAAAAADLLVVGFGAPKQELWVHRHRRQLQAKAAVCAGATIDFLAENRQRSPVWMRRVGLEWLHRVCSEPRRLAIRYARDAWVFPRLVWREWRVARQS